MRVLLWFSGLWPGFVQAWLAARWEGLALAIAFAGVLNLALVSSFVPPEWPVGIPGMGAAVAWLVVLVAWLGGLVWFWREGPRIGTVGAATKVDPELEAWFCEAQHEYLKGHWVEAESLVRNVLHRQPCDAEGRLLLAAVQRQTRRWNEAKETLNHLKGNPTVAKWSTEIETEFRRISEGEDATGNVNEGRAA